MDLPLLGTIDLTPSGIFLIGAALLAIGYFGYQLFGTGRAGRNAAQNDAGAPTHADDPTAANPDAIERPQPPLT